jgi:oxygen-dependent protoporphyrinogen oxidase
MSLHTQVAIVGGGIAGLALAHGLRARHRRARGRSRDASRQQHRSEPRDGWLCEWGPNGFLDNEPATLRSSSKWVPVARSARRRAAKVLDRAQKPFAPTSPNGFLKSDVLSTRGKLRVLFEPLQPARRDGEAESVYDFAHRRIGREAADVLVDAMVTGIYAGDARRLELQATFPRLATLEREHGGLFKGMRAARGAGKQAGGGSPLGPGGTLTSFDGGMEAFPRALASALGERLHLGAGVRTLARSASGWTLGFESGATWTASRVVLACPAWTAAPLVRAFDDAFASELDAIPSAPVAVIYTGFAAADVVHVERGFGYLVPSRERLGILGTLFESSIFPHRAPADHVLWRTMIGGARDRGALDRSDEELVERARKAFALLLGVRAQPVMTYVVRHARGIAQYPLGHTARLARIDALLQAHPGLHVSGSSYHGVSLNACIAEAEGLVSRLSGSK